MPDDPPAADARAPAAAFHRVEAVINAASGSTGPTTCAELKAVLDARGLDAHIAEVPPAELEAALRRAVDAAPDLLIVLAGDGTARRACELAGPDGPVVAALPGGTMNMLPFALYGRRPWREALADALERGEVRPVSGGEADGRRFYVAAILGAPTLWARAREAMRHGQLRRAWVRARLALSRAFGHRLRYSLDGGGERRAEALSLMCPLVSRAMTDDRALDVAALHPRGAGEALRLGARTLLADMLGDWREDPAVDADCAREIRVRSHRRIPAVLDGEPVRLPRDTVVRWRPGAFRALILPDAGAAPASPAPAPQVAEAEAARTAESPA